MWGEILRHLPRFGTAVLSGRDADGYPYSVRCRPTPDHASRLLGLDLAADDALEPGPASLLCHDHDENLWNQKAFLVRGRLERGEGGGWAFVPERFIPGIGVGGARGMARFLIGARRSAARYLKERGSSRPRIPWAEIDALKGEGEASAVPPGGGDEARDLR